MSDKTDLDSKSIYKDLEKTHMTSISDGELKNTMPLSRKALLKEIKIEKRAQLEVHGITPEPTTMELKKTDFIIGRVSDCDLTIPVDDVSRNHAKIFFRNEEYYVEDLGSTNGTFVNGITVAKCVLRNNDQIEIGEVRMIFVEVETRD